MAHAKSTDPTIFILPDLGEGVHEAELISWKVKPGERVEEHQTVAEMETDKALVEVPSPRAGVIKELRGNPGDIMKVGEIAWTYEGAAGAGAAPAPGIAAASGGMPTARGGHGSTPPKQAAPAHASPRPSARDGGHADVAQEEREDAGTVVGQMTGGVAGMTATEGKALATPAVRRLARDMGVDIDAVAGSGIGGRVTEKDVRAASSGGGMDTARSGHGSTSEAQRMPTQSRGHAARAEDREIIDTTARESTRNNGPATLTPTSVPDRAPARIPAQSDITRIPFRGVRRTIANRLRQSVDTAVHFTVMDEADVSALDGVRKRMAAASGEKLSFLPFVMSAVCRALKAFPSLNSTVDDEAGEINRHRAIHLGMAADTEHGLTVPVIFDADSLGALQIAREIESLARATRDRSIARDQLMGSTFTVSNVGSYAGRFATPVINYPEVAILGVGRVREGVAVKDGAIRIAKLMPLSLAADHRTVDGAEAARCLQHIIDLLQAPEGLLTPARG